MPTIYLVGDILKSVHDGVEWIVAESKFMGGLDGYSYKLLPLTLAGGFYWGGMRGVSEQFTWVRRSNKDHVKTVEEARQILLDLTTHLRTGEMEACKRCHPLTKLLIGRGSESAD